MLSLCMACDTKKPSHTELKLNNTRRNSKSNRTVIPFEMKDKKNSNYTMKVRMLIAKILPIDRYSNTSQMPL